MRMSCKQGQTFDEDYIELVCASCSELCPVPLFPVPGLHMSCKRAQQCSRRAQLACVRGAAASLPDAYELQAGAEAVSLLFRPCIPMQAAARRRGLLWRTCAAAVTSCIPMRIMLKCHEQKQELEPPPIRACPNICRRKGHEKLLMKVVKTECYVRAIAEPLGCQSSELEVSMEHAGCTAPDTKERC